MNLFEPKLRCWVSSSAIQQYSHELRANEYFVQSGAYLRNIV